MKVKLKSKVCSTCGKRQDVTRFAQLERRSDGLGSRCLGCRVAANRAYRRRNRDEVNAWGRAYASRADVKRKRLARDRAKRAALAKAKKKAPPRAKATAPRRRR